MNDYNNTPLFEIPPLQRFGLDENTYSESLQIIYKKSQNIFPRSKFGIALVSSCYGNKWEQIRNAQYKFAMKNKNAFITADSDKIKGKDYRYDGCHFSSKGAEVLGKEYFISIKKFLKEPSYD